jgi:hypothetical protein
MTEPRIRRRLPLLWVLLIFVALVGVVLAVAIPATRARSTAGAEHHHGETSPPGTPAQAAFHDQMRKLWEDHVTWTRLAIVTFADGSTGFGPTADRLLQNQADLGAAIEPYYGKAAGAALTSLLRDHITVAVDILKAAKAGDTAAVKQASTRWYANADDIADLLAKANPRFWPAQAMRAAMKAHLDQTLAEASHELGGRYAASVADYDAIHHHILAMADQLSAGIVGQFPARFR